PAQIPFRHRPAAARFGLPVVKFLVTHLLTTRTLIGRKVRPYFITHAAPLIRTKLKHLTAAGVEQVSRTVGARGGLPELEDGRVLDATNVIWCTGFRYDFGWIDLPVFDQDGQPMHRRGVIESEPGLSFVGLLFQFAAVSDVLPGVGRDAEFIAKHIASRSSNGRAARTERAPMGQAARR